MDFKAIKEDENKLVNLCTATSTISDIIGGITSFMTHYFMEKFPDNFFKKVYISESINFKNLYRDLFQMQYKPYLFVQPQFELGNHIMGQLPVWSKANYMIFKDRSRSYKKILQDDKNRINIYYIPNRMKVNFTLGIRLQTQMEAWNILGYIDQQFENNGHYFINKVNLQSELPKSFVIQICKLLDYNYNDRADRILLQEYLNQHSVGGIEEIINQSTGNPSYVFNYFPNILTTYPDLASHERNMKNLVMNYSQVNYAIGTEFWFPGTFIMECDNLDKHLELDYKEDLNDLYKYKYNLAFDKDHVLSYDNDKELLIKRKFITDVNVTIDKLNLDYILEDRLQKIIKLMLKHSLNPNKLFKVHLYTNGIRVPEDSYDVDYENLILKTFKPLSNQTYYVYIYADLKLLNKINKIVDTKNEDNIVHIYI